MLAQNFQTAEALGIPEPHRQALMKTLVLLETGKLKRARLGDGTVDPNAPFTGHFNMAEWKIVNECGTVCCIGGTAELIGGVVFDFERNWCLEDLFYPDTALYSITVPQAARALRSYLTTGEANWKAALSD